MDISELKEMITSNKVGHSLLVFLNSEHGFIADQYTKEIATQHNLPISYIDDLNVAKASHNDIFSDSPKMLCVYKTHEFKYKDSSLSVCEDLIIIADKIDKDTSQLYNEFIIDVPKLESWQIVDYIKSYVGDIKESDLENFVKSYDNDIYKIENEISKVTVFDKGHQLMFDTFMSDNTFSDIVSYDIFNLTNAIMSKDIGKIILVLSHINDIDTNVMGFISILYKNVLNAINIQLDPRATAESLGMSNAQFFMVKKSCTGFYMKEELIKIFKMLTNLDYRIKAGDMPASMVMDYIIVNMLGV